MFARKKIVNDVPVIEELKIYSDKPLSKEKIEAYQAESTEVTQCCNHYHLKGEKVSSMPFSENIPEIGSKQEQLLDLDEYVGLQDINLSSCANAQILFFKNSGQVNKTTDIRSKTVELEENDPSITVKECCDHQHLIGEFLLEPVFDYNEQPEQEEKRASGFNI
jgi:hypothetical protein